MNKTKIILISIVIGMFTVPIHSIASEIISGRIVGLTKVTDNIEKSTTKAGVEKNTPVDLILFEVNNKLYKIVNVPNDEIVKYVNRSARIAGNIYDKYNIIEAEEIRIRKRTRYVKVWSDERLKTINKWKKWEQEQKDIYSGENMGG